jgi:hypothetical protein
LRGGPTKETGGNGGYGGWGGGGGGGGDGPTNNGRYGIAGYGGGNGGSANNNGGAAGGGGAGLGGAVYNDFGTVIITSSTLAGNAASGGAGGASNSVNGQAGSGLGGAVFNDNGSLAVFYSTLDNNRADRGGAVFSIAHGGSFASVDLGNSILADSLDNADFWGANFGSTAAYIAAAPNLIQNNHGFAPPSGSPALLTGLSAELGPLVDNGGPTPTMAPLAGSPVINQGSSFLSNSFDQRGLPRIYNNGLDLGAVELNPAAITVNTSNEANTNASSLALFQAVELADGTLTRAGLSTAQDNLVQGDPASGVTTIQFAANLAGQTIRATSAMDNAFGPTAFNVSNTNLTIIGLTGNQGVTLDGPGAAGNLRLFRVAPGASLTLKNLTLKGGNAVGYQGGNANNAGGGGGGSAGLGGAILNQGNLTLVNSTLTGDTAQGGAGGQSSPSFSAGGGGGGAGLQYTGVVALAQAGGDFGGRGGNDVLGGPGYAGGGGGGGAGLGGAIFNDRYSSVTILNSTLYADQALGGNGGGGFAGGSAGQGAGGALFNYFGTVTVTNSTLAGNTAGRGGAIFSDQSPLALVPVVTLNNTILANSAGQVADYDTTAAADAAGSGGSNNLIVTNAGFQGGIVSSANPKVSTLANHGGPTPTLELLPGSPAIDTGNDTVLSFIAQAEGVATANATDQLGNARIFGAHIDLGAVEYHPLATSLAFVKQPATTTAGQKLTPVQVEVLDQFGNLLATDNSDPVTLSGAPFASGSTPITVQKGIATFNNLVIDKAGTYVLTAAVGNLTSAVAKPFTVNPAAPAALTYLTEPSNVTAGHAITPAVQVALFDRFGNLATNSTVSVTMSLANNPGGATLSGTRTVPAVNGVATFSTLTLTVAASGNTLKATDGGLSVTSTAFSVAAGAPAGVDIHGQPSNTVVGRAIDPGVRVVVVDAFGNTVTTSDRAVTLSLLSGPAHARLEGTTTVHAVDGVAVFGDLTLSRAGTYTLKASGGDLTPDRSVTFTVRPAEVRKEFVIHRGALREAGTPGRYEETVTFINIGGNTLHGPLGLLLGSLPKGVALTNAVGAYAHRPYLDALRSGGSLRPGQSVTVTLKFSGPPGLDDIRYSLDVLEGI